MQVRRFCRCSIAQKWAPTHVMELTSIFSNWKNSPDTRTGVPVCDWGIGVLTSWHFCAISWSKNGSFSIPWGQTVVNISRVCRSTQRMVAWNLSFSSTPPNRGKYNYRGIGKGLGLPFFTDLRSHCHSTNQFGWKVQMYLCLTFCTQPSWIS